MKRLSVLLWCILFFTFNFLLLTSVHAVSDPTSVPNNKIGIHLISATPDEASLAAQLINSSGGDWGYITVLIESGDRNETRWKTLFNDFRRRHLIPVVRLATQPQNGYWKRPYEGEEIAWADFLDNLNWPVKNRYVTIYNEPNQAKEWGNEVDAKYYAQVLDKTIKSLKAKSSDFFVLNAGLDASAPDKLPAFQDEESFLEQMNEAVPGIFNKLDGWVSHSYPNPNFTGSPNGFGRGTIRTWVWEQNLLAEKFHVRKKLPVFITETGWQHAEGVIYDASLPTADQVARNFKTALSKAWNNDSIIAITPFILNYQEIPFDHFSFQKIPGEKASQNSEPDNLSKFYPQFQTVQNLPKISGRPKQQYSAKIISGSIYNTLVSGESYTIALTVKNTGQSIWNETDPVKLIPLEGSQLLDTTSLEIPFDQKIEPGSSYTFNLKINARQTGFYNVKLNLYHGSTQFDSEAFNFTTEIKSPVVLKVKASLKWKKSSAGEYVLNFAGIVSDSIKKIVLGSTGFSDELAVKSILPDQTYDFTLKKPFYIPKTIRQQVKTGVNTLDFGQLQPDIGSAVLHPRELWKLMPFSN